MNAGIENCTHPSVIYYDGDYPSRNYCNFPENFDDIAVFQGLAFDGDKYADLANKYGRKILELCCGTGRIAIPLAEKGNHVTALDFCQELLDVFQLKADKLPADVRNNISIALEDVRDFELENKEFDLVVCAFNSLLCIIDQKEQIQVLQNAAKHLRPGGMLALDLMNPFILNFAGDAAPRPFFTRKHPETGAFYTRFAAMGPMSFKQTQKLYGWYDEFTDEGTIKRRLYEMYWRPVFYSEIELMLEKAGFVIDKVYGGHRDEVFSETSRKMFVQAIKI